MTPSPAVVFDLGKVLVDFDFGIAAANLARRSGRAPREIRLVIDQSPLLHRLESGRISEEEFFEEARRATGFSGDYGEFESLFADIFKPIPEMIALHARLRAAGVPLFIFSNTNGFAVRQIRKQFPFFAGFDDYILSYEHGAMKPEAALYEVVERKTGRRGAGLLYVDDLPQNIETARRHGWKTIPHTSADETIRKVREAGLLPGDWTCTSAAFRA